MLLPPTKIKDDVLSPDTLPAARSRLLQLMCTLYLHNRREAPHPMLAEALWDMLRSLAAQLRAEPLESFSRYVAGRAHDLPQLLCEDWAPLCLATLRNTALQEWLQGSSASEAHLRAAGEVRPRAPPARAAAPAPQGSVCGAWDGAHGRAAAR